MTEPQPRETDRFVAVLQADAARLAELLKADHVDKATRQAVRSVLWRVFAVLTPPPEDEAEVPAAPEQNVPTPAVLLELVREVETWLRKLGDDRGSGAKKIKDVRVQRPLADRVAVPPSSRQTQKLADAVGDHFKTRIALTDERLQWFEGRVAPSAPTAVATVKQPEGDADRLELELLRKAGKSKFS